jgi:amino acid adenylation domain-containing protein/thioester reductase-like protein/non-ribosomal peptide synthase protein (TIGR01720 family)
MPILWIWWALPQEICNKKDNNMQNQTLEGYRISPQQTHLWSLQQKSPSAPFHSECTLIVEGNLQLNILEDALNTVVNRYEILRTTFPSLTGMTLPLQVINESYKASIQHYDLSHLESSEKDIKVEDIIDELRQYPFDFEQGPLFRVSVITLSTEKHLLFICLSALIADTATVRNFIYEIGNSYTACLRGQELCDEPMQYADFAEWQNELVEADDTEVGKEFWQKQDISDACSLKLPFEFRVSAKSDFSPQLLSIKIENKLYDQLEKIVKKYQTSYSNILLSCWLIILSRITGKKDILVGHAWSGRKYEELEKILGLFAKHLPFYYLLNENDKFIEILQKIQDKTQDFDKYQEYFTWNQNQKLFNNEKIDYLPLSFEFEERQDKYLADDVSFSFLAQSSYFEQFKVKLHCIRQCNSLNLEFHYDSNFFNIESIENLSNQFQTLLESAIQNPETSVSALQILSASTSQQLLVDFNKTDSDYGHARCIHNLFEQQVKNTPNKIAVVFEGQQLTYAELNTRANQVAHFLQQLEVKPEVVVGLFMQRSLELLFGLLGILKAGGAYLPLDPALPTESLAFRLQDAQASVILTQQQLLEKLAEHSVQTVCIDTQWSAIATQSQENPTSKVTAKNLAYVLFTSGSTGKPKGVAVEHQQIFNYFNAILKKLDLAVCNSFANVSTFAADLGNTTIFTSLCTGGCLHLISQERASDPEALADYFYHHPIDCLKIVPSHLAALLACSHPEQIIPRQRLILGGEACSWSLIEQLQQLAPQECLIFNHYGPTETTIGVLTYQIPKEKNNQISEIVPIGRPISNTQIYLLDSHLQPVPIGVPGEIYIGGAGLTRGYLNRAELTSEKFVANPFHQKQVTEISSSSERLYKTGDLARYQTDGNIEFIGRIDNQVKIRGFRIELGEIETLLRKHPAIRDTVVIACEEGGNKRLVAYIVLNQDISPTTSELREFLQAQLPEYMVPSVFMRLKALPLTPNGKVDRQALKAPDISRLKGESNFVAPRNSIEQKLAQLWSQILGLQEVGIYDNFFELGGDSILSMQIIAKARQAGLQLTPKHIFEHQTIAELAAIAQTNKVIQAEQGLVTGEIPLTPIQRWFFEQNQPDAHHWNQAIFLELRKTLDPGLLEKAIKQLLTHHDALRIYFVRRESGWEQFNANTDKGKAFTYVDVSSLSPDEQESIFDATANQLQISLNLLEGELVRVALFDLGAKKPMRLLFIIHHLVVDGVSWRILLEDLQTAYEQLSQNETVRLPSKTTSFKQWAEKLKEYASSSALKSELKHWLDFPAQQISSIPVDFPGGVTNNTVAEARTVSVTLSVEETQALLQDVPAVYQTQINDVLLSALLQTYKQWTGSNCLLLDLEGHGREEIFDDVDLGRTVGWFTTIFPVLLHLEETSNLGEILKVVKKQLRTIPNRGIGYGVLRYLSNEKEITEQLQTLPQAEIRFNYLGQSDQVLAESSLFARVQEPNGSCLSLRGKRNYLLDINGIILERKLQLNWTYSQAIHRQDTIEAIARNFVEILRSLIIHCQSLKAKITEPAESLPDNLNVTQDKLQPELSTLIADTALDPTIHCDNVSLINTNEPRAIFLTGATGFVGAFLLHELLHRTSANIYCLVRSSDAESGKHKLQSHLESYLLWNPSFNERIIPVAGDLSKPLLGLSHQQFQFLASEIDLIYHNGAAINLVYPYSVLKATNVLGTQEILRLASQLQVKPVHYISTLSVLSANSHDQVGIPYGGYAQTKWVAEKLVTAARERGIPTSIYRLGRVSGHSQTGVCNTNDRLYRMIKGFIQLGSVPNVDTTIDMTPVDYIAQSIIFLSVQKKSLGKVFHICNPHPISLSELVKWIHSFGYPLQQSTDNEWQTDMLNNSERFLDNPLYTLIPFFAGGKSESAGNAESLEETSNPAALDFDLQNTLNELASASIIFPRIDAQLLNTYFSYLLKIGFLSSPQP